MLFTLTEYFQHPSRRRQFCASGFKASILGRRRNLQRKKSSKGALIIVQSLKTAAKHAQQDRLTPHKTTHPPTLKQRRRRARNYGRRCFKSSSCVWCCFLFHSLSLAHTRERQSTVPHLREESDYSRCETNVTKGDGAMKLSLWKIVLNVF